MSYDITESDHSIDRLSDDEIERIIREYHRVNDPSFWNTIPPWWVFVLFLLLGLFCKTVQVLQWMSEAKR
jgi:hypothetical protein